MGLVFKNFVYVYTHTLHAGKDRRRPDVLQENECSITTKDRDDSSGRIQLHNLTEENTNTTSNPAYQHSIVEIRGEEETLHGNPAYGTGMAQGRESKTEETLQGNPAYGSSMAQGTEAPPLRHDYDYISTASYVMKEEERRY